MISLNSKWINILAIMLLVWMGYNAIKQNQKTKIDWKQEKKTKKSITGYRSLDEALKSLDSFSGNDHRINMLTGEGANTKEHRDLVDNVKSYFDSMGYTQQIEQRMKSVEERAEGMRDQTNAKIAIDHNNLVSQMDNLANYNQGYIQKLNDTIGALKGALAPDGGDNNKDLDIDIAKLNLKIKTLHVDVKEAMKDAPKINHIRDARLVEAVKEATTFMEKLSSHKRK